MLSRLFIAALLSPAGRGLTSWPSFVMFNMFVTFRSGILCQVWYLIVSIPDLPPPPLFLLNNYQLTYKTSVLIAIFLCTNNLKKATLVSSFCGSGRLSRNSSDMQTLFTEAALNITFFISSRLLFVYSHRGDSG